MKLQAHQPAPDFSIRDVHGNNVKLSDYRGQKVYLALNRYTGCPICNVNFHEVQKSAAFLKDKELVILSVHESSQENMENYIKDENIYGVMIPDPDGNIYSLYNTERSMMKMISGLFHGGFGKVLTGSKLYKHKVANDGHKDRVEADFLIDAQGRIVTAHYGSYVGDRLAIEDIKKFAAGK